MSAHRRRPRLVRARGGRALVRAAWLAAALLVALLVLKTFVCDVKRVESSSMEPAIFGSPTGGERVLVLYGSFELKRFDLAVIAREGEPVPIVKRIAGLPTERVQIATGDLLIDGKRLPASDPRPPPVLVYDSRRPGGEGAFAPAHGQDGRWTCEGDLWRVDARTAAAGSGEGLMEMRRPLTDAYFQADGSLLRGSDDVNDAIVECEILSGDAGEASETGKARGRILFELAEQGDRFFFALEPLGPGRARATISRREPGQSEATIAEAEVPLQDGAWTRVRCSNVDDALAFEVGDATPICREYAGNTFEENDHLKEGRTFGSRVHLGAEGKIASFRALRVLRDVAYTARGTFGTREAADLGPDEYFVLGDNSASSQDSRDWGPVHASWIVGRPVAVVWPPSRIRRLRPTVVGPCGR